MRSLNLGGWLVGGGQVPSSALPTGSFEPALDSNQGNEPALPLDGRVMRSLILLALTRRNGLNLFQEQETSKVERPSASTTETSKS